MPWPRSARPSWAPARRCSPKRSAPNKTPAARSSRPSQTSRSNRGEAVDEVVDAAAEQRESVQDAARAKAKAQRIRSEADQLTNEADLP